jgi:radical SAM family uncharacterized protein
MQGINLSTVERPSRYLGTELNSVHKDLSKVRLKVALAFPDTYEVGMSHIGLQILYHLLNQREDIAAERVYAPWLDMEKLMRERELPLCSLESSIPLREFDIVGFSLQYELCYTNVVNMLDLAKIPFYARERDERYPLIIAGGICCFNPEPVADLFDAMVIGDGEEVILEICDCYLRWKKTKGEKKGLLDELSRIEGVYVPALFEPVYNPDHTVKAIVPLNGHPSKVKKRLISDLDQTPYITNPIVPFMRIIHDRINVEIARGCTRGCRFCLAGMVCRPGRERSLKTINDLVDQSLKATGYEEISLTSLSSGDYSNIEVLVKGLMERLNGERVALSLPSLRVETLTADLIEEIRKVRKTGFTIAPEAGTQRLRDVINKGITEEQIFSTIEAVFKGGWRGIKLYFMVGLPTETEEDRLGILDLCRRIKGAAKKISPALGINVNISTFVPKPHTPFQWEVQIPIHTSREINQLLTRELRRTGLNPKWQEPEMSLLEGVFARGDRRLSKVIIDARKMGCRFDGWKEALHSDLWQRAFEENGIDVNFYTSRHRSLKEFLPWSHIDPLVEREFLEKEREKAFAAILTPDCRTGECRGCGACTDRTPGKMSNVIRRGGQMTKFGVCPELNASKRPAPLKEKRFHCRFFKLNEARLFSHLEMIMVFSRAIRREGIPIKYSEGFHPLPRIISGPALPVGMESICESIDFVVSGDMSPSTFLKKMNRELPSGLKFLEAEEVPLKFSPVSDTIHNVNYLISLASSDSSSVRLLEQLKGAPELKGKGVGEGEKPLSSLEIGVLDSTFLSVRMEKKMGLSKALQGFFHIDPNGLRGMRVLKTQFIKGN